MAAFLLLETGILSYITRGAFFGISVSLGYLLVSRFLGSKNSQPAKAKMQAPAMQSPPAPQPVVEEPILRRQSMPPQTPGQPLRAQRTARKVVCLSPATPRIIPKRQRLTDLTNSLSISLAATFLVTLAVYLTTSLLPQAVHAVYFGAVTMLGAWTMMILCKLREGRTGDVMMRRLTQGALGLGVGFVAAGLQNYLMLSTDPLMYAADAFGETWVVGRILVANGTGYPTMAAFMLFFGILFAARRWWWQTDSFRRSRFRISSTLVTLLVGAVVAGVLHFPGVLGATWALAISAVVQLSAGWTPPEERLLKHETPDSFAAEALAEAMPPREQMPVASA
jgi:hypothetical protein